MQEYHPTTIQSVIMIIIGIMFLAVVILCHIAVAIMNKNEGKIQWVPVGLLVFADLLLILMITMLLKI